MMGQKNGIPFLITLGKDRTEGAGGHRDPAGAQGDDSQHNQECASQEIVSGVNRRKKQEGRERKREEGNTESPWHPTVTCSILI